MPCLTQFDLSTHRVEPLHPDDVEPGEPEVADLSAGTGDGIETVLGRWPKQPQESARRLMSEYGPPHEYSASRLIWYDTKDGWKRTELSREEVPHDFPAHHMDFLEQFIDYRVPVDKFTDLARFDGSLIVERTKGEMSARCAGTSMNFVAINLAHDIVTGKRSVDDARAEYTNLYLAYQRGEHPAYTTGFQFPLAQGDTRDLDRPTI